MTPPSTTPTDSRADEHRTYLTRREFLGTIAGAITSLFVEPDDPPDLPEAIPFGPRWHMWWPGTLDADTRDRMIWAWDWSISEKRARAILRAAANREYSVDELRENAEINRVYKQVRPPDQSYVK